VLDVLESVKFQFVSNLMRNSPGSVVSAESLLIAKLPGKLHLYLHQKPYTSI